MSVDEELELNGHATCDECGAYHEIYHRPMYAKQLNSMRVLLEAQRKASRIAGVPAPGVFVHAPTIFDHTPGATSEGFAILRFRDFIEKGPEQGQWRVTGNGVSFLEHGWTTPRYIYLRSGRPEDPTFVGFSEECVNAEMVDPAFVLENARNPGRYPDS